MAADHPKRLGLAGRIIFVTLTVGAITVLTASVVAVLGASRLAGQQTQARDQASLEIVNDAVLGRLSSVENIAGSVAQAVSSSSSDSAIDARISPMFSSWVGLADRVVVEDRAGRIVTAFPPSAERGTSSIEDTVLEDALTGGGGFERMPTADGSWTIWLTQTVLTPKGTPEVVLVRTGSDFLREAVQDAAGSSDRLVMVFENGYPLASSGTTDPAIFTSASWQPVPGQAGTVVVPGHAGSSKLVGYYSDVRGIEGIDWRIVVLEPDTVVMRNTVGAVTPTILVLLLGGVFGIVAVLIVSQRLMSPLRALEQTAYRAANGSFVQPVPVESSDEIAAVASAFNAVSLRLNALHDLAQLLASASQLDQVLDGIVLAMRHIVGSGVVAIYALDADGRWFVPARARGVDVANLRRVPAAGEGLLAQAVAESDVVVRASDPACMEEDLPGLPADRTAVLTAPLISGHEPLGAIVVLRRQGEGFTEAEREMVRTFSAQAAIAMHNSRLFEAETEALRIAEVLRAVAERFVRPGELAEALHDVEHLVNDLFDTSAAQFVIVDRSAVGLQSAVNRASEQRLLALATRLCDAAGPGAVVRHFGDDAGADEVMREYGARALMLVPVARESDHGAFLVVPLWRSQVSDREIDLAEVLATEVSLALENAYLFQRALDRAENLETVFKISQTVGSSLRVNVVLNRVLDVVQKILSADAVALMTYDERKRAITTEMARGAVPAEFVSLELRPGEDVPGYVFSTGEPAAFRDLTQTMDGVCGAARRAGMRSLLAVPLLARGRSIGVLMVFSADQGAFADEDLNILQTFASQAALALDTARLYSREHEVASILQESIVPEAPPEFPELEAASVYQPVGAEAEIGGDYYDLFRAADGAIWFAIADVCGKGVIAATKTSMIKYSVRAFVSAGLSPGAILSAVNRSVAESGDASDIVTLWLGRFDPDTSELCYANGGHPPGIVRRADGTFDHAEPTGPLLGAVSDVDYGEETMKLGPGDMVLLYTDGVTEARRDKEFFGEGRVEEAMVDGGVDEVVTRLLTMVRRWVHGELRDDIALLAVALRADVVEHG